MACFDFFSLLLSADFHGTEESKRARYALLSRRDSFSFHATKAPRHVNATKQTLPPDVITKRTKRHLEELEVILQIQPSSSSFNTPQRSNYTEPSITLDNDDEGVISGKNRVRQIVSDKRHLNDPSVKKKKSSMKVRTALLYRKNLATLIEESVSSSPWPDSS
jgi:zinc finger HIT domain-containing protein 1